MKWETGRPGRSLDVEPGAGSGARPPPRKAPICPPFRPYGPRSLPHGQSPVSGSGGRDGARRGRSPRQTGCGDKVEVDTSPRWKTTKRHETHRKRGNDSHLSQSNGRSGAARRGRRGRFPMGRPIRGRPPMVGRKVSVGLTYRDGRIRVR